MKFEPPDFEIYNRPPFFPQAYSRGEAKKFVSFDDEKFEEVGALIGGAAGWWDIDAACGPALDRLGRLLDVERGGAADGLYRRLLRLKVILNTGKGSVNDIIRAIKFIYLSDTVVIKPDWPAGIVIERDGEGAGFDYNAVLSRIVPAGVAFASKELFYFTDAFAVSDALAARALRSDADHFRDALKLDGSWQLDGSVRLSDGYTEVLEYKSGRAEVEDARASEAAFFGRRRRFLLDGSWRLDGSQKLDGGVLVPLGE